ncbi:MAG: helix-turn-helix domain-containing protein [Deltaproteobacteria bacterium]|nr:helix-turn-helix domain-containing protein [Deltaproteobacteria bacterium]
MSKQTKEMTLREARESKGLSLREAAKLLGVTHPYLSGLELGHKPLRTERAQEIAKAYGLSRSINLIQPLPSDSEDFTGWLREQLKWWDSRFVLPMIPAVTSTISELYVPPFFLVEGSEYRRSDKLLRDFFSDDQNRALLLTGSIGSGKSFFLRMLVLDTKMLLSEAESEKQYVPIFVSLGDFELMPGSLIQSLVSYYEKLGYEGSLIQLERFFKQCIERGNALFLFDGLDEINSQSQRVATFALLQRFFESNLRGSGNKMIISGQEVAFVERDMRYKGFLLAKLEHWHPSQMYEACRKWSWEDKNQARDFWLLIQGNPALYRLARWPLLFHLLTTLHSAYGLTPFQEVAGLYDACCEVLENSWASARRILVAKKLGPSSPHALEDFGWLKWRHFLIHLMKYAYERSIQASEPISYSFTGGEIKECWESFLADRGISRQSIQFARLQDLILLDKRIGPMFCQKAVDENGREVERYNFLEESFGKYYLAKALIDQPEQLEPIILEHLRDYRWQQIIPLIIQELGRSERAHERKLGESLIELIMSCDDEMGLEHRHKIGAFGLLTAMRSIGSYNIEKFRKSIFEPVMDYVLVAKKVTWDVERASAIVWRIMGEYNAVPQIRQYCQNKFDELYNSPNPPSVSQNYRWAVHTLMAIMGEQFEHVLSSVEKDIKGIATGSDLSWTSDVRVGLRRELWRQRYIGRLFVLDEFVSSQNTHHPVSVEKLHSAVMQALKVMLNSLQKELKTKKFRDYQYWYIFIIALKTQRKLHRMDDLRECVNAPLRLVIDNFQTIAKEYLHRIHAIQFLKAAARYNHLIDEGLSGELLKRYEKYRQHFTPAEQLDFESCRLLFQLGKATNNIHLAKSPLYETLYGECALDLIKKWVDTIRKQSRDVYDNVIELGTAICCLGQFYDRIENDNSKYGRKEVIQSLLTAFQIELNIDDQQLREEDRCFTRPFSDYCFPLYDHFYNTLKVLASQLPVIKTEGNVIQLSSARL